MSEHVHCVCVGVCGCVCVCVCSVNANAAYKLLIGYNSRNSVDNIAKVSSDHKSKRSFHDHVKTFLS